MKKLSGFSRIVMVLAIIIGGVSIVSQLTSLAMTDGLREITDAEFWINIREGELRYRLQMASIAFEKVNTWLVLPSTVDTAKQRLIVLNTDLASALEEGNLELAIQIFQQAKNEAVDIRNALHSQPEWQYSYTELQDITIGFMRIYIIQSQLAERQTEFNEVCNTYTLHCILVGGPRSVVEDPFAPDSPRT
ncbi:MAG: hypothetical protein M3Q81_04020 [bacterium]|nr:hypothetical protein [bacterium]